MLPPLDLDVTGNWPNDRYDAAFSANTAHIMHLNMVESMFTGVAEVLKRGGRFCLYGPFNYEGRYTSESNAQFDLWLKARDPGSAIRDFEALNTMAEQGGMTLLNDHAMPANNRILVWEKVG
ncbi:hypothetical protein BOW53_11745 [Solemya pervernicosa gill symbiont]|uniref:Methylase n=1 Tax=Solemya pervernicosa gill symbiont TaxID=642797 RepID=A0A1T2L2Q5_9GAMM|nr:DUF938 domain-containing protein [Candidatus Reidiella endopervernicosa]OOZ39373.1 hypothetical protein BOW53_11745 [Solemya pervernicosa gill symbiont]